MTSIATRRSNEIQPAGRPTGTPAAVGSTDAGGLLAGIGVAVLVAGLVAVANGPLPLIVLAALLAAAGVAARPERATDVFLFTLYLNVPAVATKFHGVPPIVAASFVAILVLPFLHYVVIRRMPILLTATGVAVLAYLASLLVSSLASADIAASSLAISVFLTEGLLLFFLVLNVVRTVDGVRRAMWTIVIAAAVMGAISIWQETTRSYGNPLGGFAQLNEIGFNVADQAADRVIRPRLAGPIGEQNRYAQVLLVALPLAAYRFWGERDRRLRALAGAASLLILAGIFLSFSRGAAVALAGLAVALAVIGQIRLRQLGLLATAAVATMLLFAPQYLIRLDSLAGVTSLLDDEGTARGADGAILGRATSNLAALTVFLDHPVLGVGPGQYFREYSQVTGNELGLRHFFNQRRAHNLYLETMADLGIVGFSALMFVVGSVLVPLARLRRMLADRPELGALASGMLLSVAAYLFTGVFLHLSYERYFWVMIALAAATVHVLRGQLSGSPPVGVGAPPAGAGVPRSA